LAILHSDFVPGNLLFQEGVLTGIIDFESTHLNYRVADFALAWRGSNDEVIEGYEEVTTLSEVERRILVPTFWSWLFLGVESEVRTMVNGLSPVHGFDWQVKHMLRRSRFHDGRVPAYPR
jgi:aminoglycoside phosphotransferase (APT) family kinase protein